MPTSIVGLKCFCVSFMPLFVWTRKGVNQSVRFADAGQQPTSTRPTARTSGRRGSGGPWRSATRRRGCRRGGCMPSCGCMCRVRWGKPRGAAAPVLSPPYLYIVESGRAHRLQDRQGPSSLSSSIIAASPARAPAPPPDGRAPPAGLLPPPPSPLLGAAVACACGGGREGSSKSRMSTTTGPAAGYGRPLLQTRRHDRASGPHPIAPPQPGGCRSPVVWVPRSITWSGQSGVSNACGG